eukprot:1624607-Rhodomonas_salina.2
MSARLYTYSDPPVGSYKCPPPSRGASQRRSIVSRSKINCRKGVTRLRTQYKVQACVGEPVLRYCVADRVPGA